MGNEPNFCISKIKALRTVWEKSKELSSRINALGEPVLHDIDLIPRMYDIYLEVFRSRGNIKAASRVYHRKKFILIVLYLYSPKTLVGGRMRKGIRSKISELFGLNTGTPISDNCTSVIFNYDKYRDFRRDVDFIYKKIVTAMGDDIHL